ncbi:MAG: zinc ribbon domain-containing protein [Deltaproteobacteria bacterium]|nr:zinc ribbon domain-containing protein [Deltaproteobacteria bacterium]MBW2305533.1 zinc ribbon domain-containing protein [Deltaproteobacteria bacterium]
MPIYEYECKSCGRRFSRLVMKVAEASGVRCKGCGSSDLGRLISRVVVMQTEKSRLENLDTGKSQDENYYRDSRNIGLWAKKRAQDLGADLGPQFEETLEKARSGKILDEL